MELKPGYKQSEVGVIPEDWEVNSVVNLVSITTGARNTQDKVKDGLYPFFVRSATVERINSFSFDGEAVLTAGDGVGTGKIYHYVKGKFDYHQRVYCMHSFNEQLDGYYFYLHFSNHFLSRVMAMTAKSSVDSVRREMIANMKMPLPPLPEQRAIAAALSDTEALLSSLDRLLAKKRDIKQAVMQQLLTGKQRLPGFSGEWNTEKVGRLFKFLSTGNNPRSDLSAFGDVGYVHYGDIHTKEAAFLDCANAILPLINYSKVSRLPLLQDGDLVMADASEDYAGVGKSVEIKNVGTRKIVAGLHTFLLRSDQDLLADGYKGYLQFLPSVKSAMTRYATGISVYGISKTNIRNIEINLPGLAEQTAIAAVLSDMDAEIGALQQRRDKTRAVKQGMMQELLTGRTRLI